jgi:GntR family transcriptional regulator
MEKTSRDAKGPLYSQLAEELKRIIREEHRQGDVFMSESQIEQRFRMSRITVRHALRILELEGYIYRGPGKPTLVSRIEPVVDVGHRFGRLAEELRGMGLSVAPRHFDVGTTETPREEFRRMGIEHPHPLVFRVKHILSVDAKPLSFAVNYVLDDPDRIRITPEDLAEREFYSILEADYDISIINGDQYIGAVLADPELAGILNVKVGAPLLRTAITAFTKEGSKKLYAVVHYDANLFQFRQLVQH